MMVYSCYWESKYIYIVLNLVEKDTEKFTIEMFCDNGCDHFAIDLFFSIWNYKSNS